MHHVIIEAEHYVTLTKDETFLLLGDRVNSWPMVVKVLMWQEGGTYVQAAGYRADRDGEALTHQPTSECLVLGHDARLKDFPAWLADALSRGSSPLILI